MKKKDKFLVFYSEYCTPHIGCFNTHRDAVKFISKFYQDHSDNRDDHWVDFVVKGELDLLCEGFKSYIVIDNT
jgi:hypothetical protein